MTDVIGCAGSKHGEGKVSDPPSLASAGHCGGLRGTSASLPQGGTRRPMLCLIYLGAILRNGVSLCGRKCFWLRLLLVSWLVPPFPFKRPRQMPLGVAAIRPPRQGTLAITRRVGRSSAGARVNGSCIKPPIGVALRRRPSLSKMAGDPRPARVPFHLGSHPSFILTTLFVT
jgi:hypothetical protein